MKGKTRYILLVCGLVLYHYLLRYINGIWTNNLRHPSWKWRNELPYGLDSSYISSTPRGKSETSNHSNCRMETCFDFTKCHNFKIYVYPDDERLPPSDQYSKILEPIRRSKYYTEDPGEACLFVLSLDTLNR